MADNKGNSWSSSPKNGPKGLGRKGKGAGSYGAGQLASTREKRKRINKNYGGGK